LLGGSSVANQSLLQRDRSASGASGRSVALHFISTEVDTQRSFTYRELADEVTAFAAVLQSLGLKRGDRAIILLANDSRSRFFHVGVRSHWIIHSVVFLPDSRPPAWPLVSMTPKRAY